MVNKIVRGGESRRVEDKQVRSIKSLSIVHQNIRSLWGKCEELEILLATELKNVEVLCFTEHWLNCNKVKAVNINNYILANAFCRKNSDHGGSCIFVKQGIITKEINFLNDLGEDKSIEMSAVEIVKFGIIVICIYRSPDGQAGIFFNKLEMIMQKLIRKHKTLILCGDWNIDTLKSSPHAKELNNLLLRYNLKNLVNTPTRITKNTASLLDVVITNEKNYVNLSVMDLGLSDHIAQNISISIPETNNTFHKVIKRKFNEINTQEFLHLLKQVTWKEVLSELDTNVKLSAFMDIFLYCYNVAFPTKTMIMRNGTKSKWITQGIKTSSKRMRLLEKQRKITKPNKKDLEYINQYRKIYKKVIQEAKRRENDTYISSSTNKIKATWKLINQKRGKPLINNRNIELKWGKSKISDPRTISEVFNSYYVETIERVSGHNKGTHTVQNMSSLKINSCAQTMYITPVSESEIEKVIKNLKGKSSSGFDGVTEFIVKKCVQFIKKPLADICNSSFASGTFPEILKVAIVQPLHKKGDTGEVQNYRPISLLSVFSKIIEKLMYSRLLSFFTKNGILNEAQHGFRKGKSTETAIHTFLENIQEAIEKKKHLIGIFLDLSKAYDVLDHKILLYKLNTYGVRGLANQWFTSYLSNRKQYVEINHMDNTSRIWKKYKSSLKDLKGGVPQGSILSPILFLIYINDLPINIQSGRITLFADDTNIQLEATNALTLTENIREVLQQLSSWLRLNKLVINPDKTIAMSFHAWQNKNNLTPEIILQNKIIKYKNETRFLGVYLTDDIKWDMHVKHVCNALNKNYYVIHSLKNALGINVLRSIYFACFHSHLRYGIIFWGGDSQGVKVFKLQKKVVRLMCNVKKTVSCRDLFRKLSILPMPCVHILETILYIKMHKGGLKQNLAIHEHETRHRFDFQTQFCRTDIYKKKCAKFGNKAI